MNRVLLCALALLLGGLAVLGWALARPRPASPPAVRVVWTFEPPQRGGIVAGVTVAGDSVYIAVVRDSGLGTSGAVYRIDRATGRPRWQFDAGGAMLHTISTPAVVAGRVYVGEGMHHDLPCRLYCLDGETGRQLWAVAAAGHIESGPRVHAGRVHFTAGDDGLVTLDARSGAPLWRYEASGHVDAAPTVVDGRLYGGSGVSGRHPASEAFCLDVRTGNPLWRTPSRLPIWAAPVVDGGQVFLAEGNGRLTQSEAPPGRPAGALTCLDAATGREAWRVAVPDGVLARPVVSPTHVYFVCRDGTCRALDRRGNECWQRNLGSPIVAAACLAGRRLYVAASAGPLAALDADTGAVVWTFAVGAAASVTPRLYSAPAVADGEIYLGTELRGAVNAAAVLYRLEEDPTP